MSEEVSVKRESESVALLQKLIRIDSKDCNFYFKDFLRGFFFKVAYQQTNIENHSNDGLLRQFWHHVYAHYFKKIELEETKRLDYIRSFLQAPRTTGHSRASASLPFLAEHPHFDQSLHSIFSQSHLGKLVQEARGDREVQLWLQCLYMGQKGETVRTGLSKQKKKKVRGVYSKLKQNRNLRRETKKSKQRQQLFRRDQQELQDFIQELEAEEEDMLTPLDQEIRQLEREAMELEGTLETFMQELDQKIEEENQMVDNRAYSRNIIYASGKSTDSNKDLQCLQFLIDCLQEKQIAQSVSKIISTERSNGEIMFKLDYERAMNIEPKLIAEKQLSRLNFLREASLINFYRTGVKSQYSFICHNYVGFRELMANRHTVSSKLKDKDLMQMMKKGACLANVGDIQHEMVKFNMCHHCKFLFQDPMLFTCRFSSDKQAIPKINIQASCDPNLAEDFQEGPNRNRTSQRFMTRKKNCLTSYAKIHDEYVCGRKYCLSCLKDTYGQENIRENGLCPFCLGVCICTRCLRNEKIAKFKAMYSMLGGDLGGLQLRSTLEHLQVKNDEQVPRGRGRPKKYMVSHIAVNATKKKLRRFGGKENHCLGLSVQLAKKGKRKQQLYSHWKKNDSGNETQEQVMPRKKVRRGVGRPRLDRVQIPQLKKKGVH